MSNLLFLDFEKFEDRNKRLMTTEMKKRKLKNEEEYDFFKKNFITEELEKKYFSNIYNDPSRFTYYLKEEEFDKKEFFNAKKMVFRKKNFGINREKRDLNENTKIFLNQIVKNEKDVNFY